MTTIDSGKNVERQEIVRQVDRIFGSSAFSGSDRIRGFLRYIVDETLAGRADSLKAYAIAVAAFGRDETFDANSDPIVRVEAGRLRRALEHYYLTEGTHDDVLITVPKGAYVPAFARNEAALPPVSEQGFAPSRKAWPRTKRFAFSVAGVLIFATALAVGHFGWPGTADPASPDQQRSESSGLAHASADAEDSPNHHTRADTRPSVLVMPFANISGDAAYDRIATAVTTEISSGLTNFDQLLIYGQEAEPGPGAGPGSAPVADALATDYALAGTVAVAGQEIRVTATLLSVPDGQYLWSGSFARPGSTSSTPAAEIDIADEIVRMLGDTYGVLFQQEVARARNAPSAVRPAYRCVLDSYQYWRRPTVEAHADTRACLERAVTDEPDYAEAWANLALIFVDEYRYGWNPVAESSPPLERALIAARRSVSLAPNAVRGYQALQLIHWLQHDIGSSFAAANRALSLNPHNSEVLADIGLRYIIIGEEERGLAMLDEAMTRQPQQSDFYLLGYVVYYISNADYEMALTYARRVDRLGCGCVHIALAAIYGYLGRPDEARPHVDAILALYPNFPETAVAYLSSRNLPPEFINRVIEGLRQAGMSIADPIAASAASNPS